MEEFWEAASSDGKCRRRRVVAQRKGVNLTQIGPRRKMREKRKGLEKNLGMLGPKWSSLPRELLLQIFQFLSAEYLLKASQVCQVWNSVGQDPVLWRNMEIKVGEGKDTTPQDLIQFVLENHSEHLKSLVLTTDSSKESAERVCNILTKLVHTSLRTLSLVSYARPVFLDVDHELFTSALAVVLNRRNTIRNLTLDYTPIDDPSLKTLARNHSKTLQHLKMKNCPRISSEGVLALADNCHKLRELSLNYSSLSDGVLLSLSSEHHVRLTHLRIDVFADQETQYNNRISKSSWQALIKHSPNLNLIMYFFVADSETYDLFFNSYTPVTHVYFCEYVPRSVLHRISKNCPRIREIVVNGTDEVPGIDLELIDLGIRCEKLTSIGLSDCYVSCSSFVEFVRITRKRLTELFIGEDCLVPDADYDVPKVITTVSELLSTNWEPEFMPLW